MSSNRSVLGSSVILGLLACSAGGCGDAPPANGRVYWLYPNGSEVNLKLSLEKPQAAF